MAATEDNPKGYFDLQAITELDNDLIERLGGQVLPDPAKAVAVRS